MISVEQNFKADNVLKYDGAGVSTVRTFTLAGCTTGTSTSQVVDKYPLSKVILECNFWEPKGYILL